MSEPRLAGTGAQDQAPSGMKSRSRADLAKWLIEVLLIAAVYYVAARLGLLLAFEKTNASPLWPPSGIAFAAVLLLGYRVWPGILLGAFLANVVVFLGNRSGDALTIVVVSSVIGIGNTLEALSGAFVLRRVGWSGGLLDRAQDVYRFVAVALFMCLVSASIGPTSLSLAGMVPWAIYATIWYTWWLGDTMGVLVVTPLLLTWFRQAGVVWGTRRLGEAALLFVSLFLAGRVAFGGWLSPREAHYPLEFIPIPFLMWAALRFGQREAATAVLLISGIAVWDTLRGFGPFVRETVNESLLLLQVFMGVVTTTILVMATLADERRRSETALRKAHDELEIRVKERTAELTRANTLLQAEITERNRIEEALRENEEKFRSLAEAANDAIVCADSAGNIIYFNKSAERIFGYSADDVIGKPLPLLMPDRFHDAHRRGFARYLSTGESQVIGRRVELAGKRKDGSEFPLELSLGVWERNEERFFVGTICDITERQRAEAEIRVLNAQLNAANKELEAFTYTVSHDLKAPLRGMEGFARALQEDYGSRLDETASHHLGMIQTSARHMGQLIDDLLRYSRLERREMRRERVSLRPLLETVCAALEGEIRARGLAVWMELAVEAVEAEREGLREALVNLVENAVKFSRREGGTIRIGSQQERDAVILSVADTGIGFDMKYHDRIFQIFERLPRQEEYPGTGVGLAIVRKVAERHGGRTWAVSEPGKGSTFYLALPTPAGGEA